VIGPFPVILILLALPTLLTLVILWVNRKKVMTQIRNEQLMREYDLSKLIEKLQPDEHEKLRRK
jgi:hypothetical protein